MKYLIVLLFGVTTGAALFAVGVAYNPFVDKQELSPLTVTEAQTLALSFSGVAAENILYTNDGESNAAPHPHSVLQLWEKSVRQSFVMATVMRGGRNQAAGIGIKMSSVSEQTNLLSGQALVDSIWYIYLPGRGGFFVEQTENYWDYIRDVVLVGYRSTGRTWAGSWLGNLTAGPGALHTAVVSGGRGEFAGKQMMAVESLSVRAWRADGGAAAAQGRLTIELPQNLSSHIATPDLNNP